ncbi:TPA: hypothetical protein SLN67_001852 [Serratia marcescens]|nr:hypothetical protein [Serratia marcescens]
MDKLREEFEAEFKRRNCNVPASRIKTMLELYNYGTEENPDWDYYSLDARHAFEWWQASRASIVVELPEMEDFELLDGYKVRESIRSIGLSIKGE